MKDLISISNYMLLNYGWLIFGVSLFIGLISTIVLFNIDTEGNSNILDDNPNFEWDEYGNPIVKD
jgi:hypothetical protein